MPRPPRPQRNAAATTATGCATTTTATTTTAVAAATTTTTTAAEEEEGGSGRGGDAAPRWHAAAALLLRLGLVVLADRVDARSATAAAAVEPAYTDVDYAVLSVRGRRPLRRPTLPPTPPMPTPTQDAAALVLRGRSPYERAAFRYSPVLALLCVPNVLIHRACGKVLFCLCDLLVGHLLCATARVLSGDPHRQLVSLVWLFNPLVIAISTRGSADSVVCVLVLCALHATLRRWPVRAGLALAAAIHLRLYPIIYTVPLLLAFVAPPAPAPMPTPMPTPARQLTRQPVQQLRRRRADAPAQTVHPSACGTRARSRHGDAARFCATTAGTLLLLTALSTLAFGRDYVNEALLHHLVRTDIQHNFAVHFYPLYLADAADAHSRARWLGLLVFVPQATAVLVSGLALGTRWPATAMFVQTITFVALNKVCTSQVRHSGRSARPPPPAGPLMSSAAVLRVVSLSCAARCHTVPGT